jgi:uncharacterized protein
MTIALLTTALVTGVLGSAHCIGMCGPIALSLPVGPQLNRHLAIFLYNIGRALTYAALGVIPGLLGNSLHYAGWSQWISIGLGIALLLFVILGFGKKVETYTARLPLLKKVRTKIGVLFGKQSYNNLFYIGLLNGLLPCGLVYTALLLAIGTGSVLYAALFMFIFGLGTIPAMFALSSFAHLIKSPLRAKLNKLVPYMLALVAILLIIRGLNLGIPLLSPKVVPENGAVECCTRSH